MPRRERVYSPTGIYHVMLRGINRNNLFLDSQDFYKMSKILKAIAKPTEINGDIKVPVCSIYAYCLMTNHIHLLISENKETISETMKRIGVAYASYFNKRYKRSGPLFEGRFRSEPVWDVEYFCTLIHYIHNNPVKAGLEKKAEWYKWSSYHEYELPEEAEDTCICTRAIPFKKMSLKEIKNIVLENTILDTDTIHINPFKSKRIGDDDALMLIKTLLPEDMAIEQTKSLPKVQRLELANQALDMGLSHRQVNAFIGISHATIYRNTKLKTVK